jgi:hypothetical protein
MLLHNATIDHEFTINDTLHSLIFEMFINLIVPTNTQTKNTKENKRNYEFAKTKKKIQIGNKRQNIKKMESKSK